MRARFAYPAGIGLVLLAFGVAFSTPANEQITEPFPVTGAVGDVLVSDYHVVTVHDVVLAEEVELGSWRGTTSGVWLVVDATVAARTQRLSMDANVFLDGIRYPGTDRIGIETLDGRVHDPGLPMTGVILVELPADVRERPGATSAVLRFGRGSDVRLDSVIELRLDLTTLETVERVEAERPQRGEP